MAKVLSPTAVSVLVPANHLITISGTATAGWTQKVMVTQTGLDFLNKDIFLGGSGLDTLQPSTDTDTPSLAWLPQPKDTTLIINFEVLHNDSFTEDAFYPAKGLSSDYSTTKLTITNIGSAYLFHTEDGGDDDYHDTNLIVSFIKSVK